MIQMLGSFGEKRKLYFIFSQWRIKDGKQVEAQTLGHISTLCSHLKVRFKQKFRPKYA